MKHEFTVIDISKPDDQNDGFGTTIAYIESDIVPCSGDYISFEIDGDNFELGNDGWTRHFVVKRIEWFTLKEKKSPDDEYGIDTHDLKGMRVHVEPLEVNDD